MNSLVMFFVLFRSSVRVSVFTDTPLALIGYSLTDISLCKFGLVCSVGVSYRNPLITCIRYD